MKKVYTGVHGREANILAAKAVLANEKPYLQNLTAQVGKEELALLGLNIDPHEPSLVSWVHEVVETKHVQQAVAAFDRALADMTRKTLSGKDFTFDSEGDFKLFCRDRLTVISFEGEPYRKEMYLDYGPTTGIYLFKFSTEITTKYENGVLTTTFG